MSTAAAFRAAVERQDIDAASELLAEDVVFHSPVVFHPFIGRETVTGVLAAAADTFEGFRYTDELEAPGVHALIFSAAIGGRELEGMDLLRLDPSGQIAEFTVMLRPLSGLTPFAQAMGEKLVRAGVQPTRS